ncbi:MAG: CcmD family protein [Rubrobacteridae bacterium]|nr:CcmD family protein [Rubrobacteridae bacterium]
MDPQAPYVIAVYLAIWAVLFIFVLFMNNKMSGLKKELEVLTKEVEKKNK